MPKPAAWANKAPWIAPATAGLLLLFSAWGLGAPGLAHTRPDLVARDRLRVCAEPANLPFSNKAREGFENKIADIVADELHVPLHYYWMPQGPGFVRNTLGTDLCDVIIGYASGADVVDHTNAYYVSTYVLVTRQGGPLEGVDRIDDPRLKGHKLGVIAATPPADHLLRLGLTDTAKTYSLLVDRRYSSPAEEALADLADGTVDGVFLWGPIGAYFAKKAATPLAVTPLVHEQARPSTIFRITFGIRPNEIDWKHKLNAVIRKRQKDIDAVLASYGVPLLSHDVIPAEAASVSGTTSEELQ